MRVQSSRSHALAADDGRWDKSPRASICISSRVSRGDYFNPSVLRFKVSCTCQAPHSTTALDKRCRVGRCPPSHGKPCIRQGKPTVGRGCSPLRKLPDPAGQATARFDPHRPVPSLMCRSLQTQIPSGGVSRKNEGGSIARSSISMVRGSTP